MNILKTYKLFIGGKFPRTESGRSYPLQNKKGKTIANICLGSRKDLRNAVVAARKAFEGWSETSAFLRSQILYRIGEILEGRRESFAQEIQMQGFTKKQAEAEVRQAIDLCIYYAGWCDKYMPIAGTVNPVSSSHFNFSVPEPMGIIGILAPEETSLIGFISALLPCIAGGNTCVILASGKFPLCAISLAEVLATSDVPGGVVNILTGSSAKLHEHFASHMDVNAVVYCRDDKKEMQKIEELSSLNVKRSVHWEPGELKKPNPYLILDLQEIKTTWHPIERIKATGGKY